MKLKYILVLTLLLVLPSLCMAAFTGTIQVNEISIRDEVSRKISGTDIKTIGAKSFDKSSSKAAACEVITSSTPNYQLHQTARATWTLSGTNLNSASFRANSKAWDSTNGWGTLTECSTYAGCSLVPVLEQSAPDITRIEMAKFDHVANSNAVFSPLVLADSFTDPYLKHVRTTVTVPYLTVSGGSTNKNYWVPITVHAYAHSMVDDDQDAVEVTNLGYTREASTLAYDFFGNAETNPLEAWRELNLLHSAMIPPVQHGCDWWFDPSPGGGWKSHIYSLTPPGLPSSRPPMYDITEPTTPTSPPFWHDDFGLLAFADRTLNSTNTNFYIHVNGTALGSNHTVYAYVTGGRAAPIAIQVDSGVDYYLTFTMSVNDAGIVEDNIPTLTKDSSGNWGLTVPDPDSNLKSAHFKFGDASTNAMLTATGSGSTQTTVAARLGDDSGDANLTAGNVTASGTLEVDGNVTVNGQTTFNDAIMTGWVILSGNNGPTAACYTSVSANPVYSGTSRTTVAEMTLARPSTTSGNYDGEMLFKTRATGSSLTTALKLDKDQNAILYGPKFYLGGTSSSYPMIYRDGNGLKARLADDSAYAPFYAGAITSSGTVSGSTVSSSGSLTGSSLTTTGAAQVSSLTTTYGVTVGSDAIIVGKIDLGNAVTGPRISFGSGAPSASDPNGSLYLRTDGTGPNIYVRQNGAWVSK